VRDLDEIIHTFVFAGDRAIDCRGGNDSEEEKGDATRNIW
jgi:hypothetical protein